MIKYFNIPELPGKTMFHCDRRNATLQVDSCKAIWQAANGKLPGNAACRACPVGAKHAGEGEVSISKLRGTEICARCHRVGIRLIGGDICVSCWNRQRELIIGKNRRGREPKNHPPVAARKISFMVGDKRVTIARTHAITTSELMVSALRDSPRQVFFGFHVEAGLMGFKG